MSAVMSAGSISVGVEADVSPLERAIRRAEAKMQRFGSLSSQVAQKLSAFGSATSSAVSRAGAALAAVGSTAMSSGRAAMDGALQAKVGWGGLLGTALAVRAAIEGVGVATGLAVDAAKFSDAFSVFRHAGGNIEDMRASTKGLISDFQLVKKANLANTMGIPAQAFKTLANVAIAASKQTGESVGFLFDSIVRGTARESKLILDNLGIILPGLAAAEKAEAKRLKTTVDDLPEATKRQLFMNEVMQQGNAILAKVAQANATSADGFTRMGVAVDNLKIAIGSRLVDTMSSLASTIDDVIRSSDGLFTSFMKFSAASFTGILKAMGPSVLAGPIDEATDAIGRFIDRANEMGLSLLSPIESVRNLAKAMAGIKPDEMLLPDLAYGPSKFEVKQNKIPQLTDKQKAAAKKIRDDYRRAFDDIVEMSAKATGKMEENLGELSKTGLGDFVALRVEMDKQLGTLDDLVEKFPRLKGEANLAIDALSTGLDYSILAAAKAAGRWDLLDEAVRAAGKDAETFREQYGDLIGEKNISSAVLELRTDVQVGDARDAFKELTTTAITAADRLREGAKEAGRLGQSPTEALNLIKAATAQQVAAQLSTITSMDQFAKSLEMSREAVEALGISWEDVEQRIRLKPGDLSDVLSGRIGEVFDAVANQLELSLRTQDRGEIVAALSDGVSKMLTGGEIDGGSIGSAIGQLIGASGSASGLISGLMGSGAGSVAGGALAGAGTGAAAGAAAGPIGSVIGVAVGGIIAAALPMLVSAVGDAATSIMDALTAIPSGIANFLSDLAAMTGESRFAAAIDGAFNPVAVAALGLAGALAMLAGVAGGALLFFARMLTPAALALGALAVAGTAVWAVYAAGVAVLAGFVGAFAVIVTQTKSFARFGDAMAGAFDVVIAAVEPFWANLIALAGLFEAVANVVAPLFAALANSETVARLVFEVFKGIGIVVAATSLVIGLFANAVLAVVMVVAQAGQSLATAFSSMIMGIAIFLATLGVPADVLAPIAAGASEMANDLRASFGLLAKTADELSPNVGNMATALATLTGLTYEEAKARGEILAREKAMGDELTNVPEGFKIAAARFKAIAGEPLSSGVLTPTAGGGAAGIGGNNFFFDGLNVNLEKFTDLLAFMEELAERKSFQQTGTTSTRDGQNNGR